MDMRNADEVAAELARSNRRLKETRAELKKAKRQFGAALVKLVKKDPDFAAALLSMLKAGALATFRRKIRFWFGLKAGPGLTQVEADDDRVGVERNAPGRKVRLGSLRQGGDSA